MVRNYKRKTDRGTWEEEDMRRAVRAVLSETMGFLRASTTYNVPKSTLERRVRKARNAEDADTDSDNDYGKKDLGRFKTVFSKDQEEELSKYIKAMEARLFGITGKELRILAFELAKRNHIENPFNEETGMAGEDWLSGFLKRHPDLSFRRPEPTSAARAMAFNKVAVSEFFTLLEDVVEKHDLSPDRIYNVDETGVSTVPKSQSKILSLKGQKQVGCLSSAERGQLITAEICFNAAGTYIPPMLIYARKRMKDELMDDAPPGFWGECSDNGWITSKLFLKWFIKFVDIVQPTEEKPVLLLLDGHASHTKNLDLIDYAREHHVILLCTPPHCTHKLQPLDVAFMRPLSTYYSAEVKKWLRDHPGRVVSPYQVAKLFGTAYLQAATMLTAINGFRKCGIWPVDKNVFTDADFVAAETTNTEAFSVGNEDSTSYLRPSTSANRVASATQLRAAITSANDICTGTLNRPCQALSENVSLRPSTPVTTATITSVLETQQISTTPSNHENALESTTESISHPRISISDKTDATQQSPSISSADDIHWETLNRPRLPDNSYPRSPSSATTATSTSLTVTKLTLTTPSKEIASESTTESTSQPRPLPSTASVTTKKKEIITASNVILRLAAETVNTGTLLTAAGLSTGAFFASQRQVKIMAKWFIASWWQAT